MNKSYSMEKLNEVNSKSFEERTNYIVENLINTETNYFKESKNENISTTRNFKMYVHANDNGKITGYALKVSHIENLACLNVYRNNKKKLSKEELKKSSDELFELISKFNFSHVVKTDSGGAMIYCNVNNFEIKEQEKFCNLAKNQIVNINANCMHITRTSQNIRIVMFYCMEVRLSTIIQTKY